MSDNEAESFLVCSWQKHTLYEYTDSADVIRQQYGTAGQTPADTTAGGQLYCPGICGTDKHGNVLIADCGNHRLQLLRRQRQTPEVRSDWQTIQLDGLQCPWDVWFQNESTFWVLNNEKMLLQYVISADDSAENEA